MIDNANKLLVMKHGYNTGTGGTLQKSAYREMEAGH